MFDIFATILSAGVVISVVTLVVHEPLLLAAGISTILGVLFLLLPVFASMTPVMGYLLIFTGLVGLGYGVLSTRSWLNVLHARRLQAQARRQQLQATRARDDTAPIKPVAPPPARGHDDEDDLPPRLAAQLDREAAPLGAGAGSSALARVGRRLGRGDPDPEPVPDVRPVGKPWRNPYDPPAGSPPAAPASARLPAPMPVQAAPVPPPPSPAAPPAKPAKLLSRGAERIKRIKAESRQASPRRPTSKPAPAQPSPPPPVPIPVPDPGEAARRARRQRDLMELELLDVEPAAAERRPAVEEDSEPRGSRPFLSRIARRS